MKSESTIHRRSFLGGMFGAAAAAGLAMTGTRAAAAQESGADDWIREVKGTHRCLFDFPQHKNGMPLLHVLNYLNTYSAAYKTGAGQVGAVGTFYSAGSQASIPLAFNDAVWAKYGLGAYTGLKDADGKPYTRNVFNRPTPKDLHLLMQAIDSPMIPALADAMPGIGIESLQKMGTKFMLVRERARDLVPRAGSQGQGQGAGHRKGTARQPAAWRDDRARDGDRHRKGTGSRHQIQPSVGYPAPLDLDPFP